MSKKLHCADCGLPYKNMGVDLVLPDHQWNALVSKGETILCPNCICQRARKYGGTVVMAWIDHLDYRKVYKAHDPA